MSGFANSMHNESTTVKLGPRSMRCITDHLRYADMPALLKYAHEIFNHCELQFKMIVILYISECTAHVLILRLLYLAIFNINTLLN